MKRISTMIIVFLSITLTLSGCHSYRNVNVAPQSDAHERYFLMEPPVYTGDKINYKLKNGTKGEMTVRRVTPQSVISENGTEILLSDVFSIEKQELSKTKSGAAISAGALAVALIGVVLVSVAIGKGITKVGD